MSVDNSQIINKIVEIQAEFCQTLRKKYDLYPFICEFGSNAILAYLSHVLPELEMVKLGTVNFGWYAHPTDSDACGNHSWVQIGNLIIDPTYEQFDAEYKDRVRIVILDSSEEETYFNLIKEYKLHEASSIISRFVKRTKDTKTLQEYLAKFEGRPIHSSKHVKKQ